MHKDGEDNLYSSQALSDISPQGGGRAKANILSKSWKSHWTQYPMCFLSYFFLIPFNTILTSLLQKKGRVNYQST